MLLFDFELIFLLRIFNNFFNLNIVIALIGINDQKGVAYYK